MIEPAVSAPWIISFPTKNKNKAKKRAAIDWIEIHFVLFIFLFSLLLLTSFSSILEISLLEADSMPKDLIVEIFDEISNCFPVNFSFTILVLYVLRAIRLLNWYSTNKFVKNLKNQDKTMVGEKGLKLSGGQRQRLGIARAIYKNSDIIIFDEATSNLDYETEKKVQSSLDKIKGKTIIVSAHRLTTLKNMDKILVMKKGMVIEQGTYDELLKKQGHFYKLLKQQGGWRKN